MANGISERVVSELQNGATKKDRRKGGKNKSISRDKENICVLEDVLYSEGNVVRKSPLPADYPRVPLQDITAVLSPANVMNLEEGESSQNSHCTQSKTRKTAISFPVMYELNVVETTKDLVQDVTSDKKEGVRHEIKVDNPIQYDTEVPLSKALEAEDCPSVQQPSKRRRPQPRPSAGAERSTSMLKFR